MSFEEEKKDIASMLKVLKEILEPLHNLVNGINTLLEQGNSWTENKGDITYTEMKELLESETSEFLRRCSSIPNNAPEMFSEPALRKEQLNQVTNSGDGASYSSDVKDRGHILGQLEEHSANVTSNSEILKTMQQKIKNQKKNLNVQIEARYVEMMQELNTATNFMSNLSHELNKIKAKQEIQEEKMQEVSQKVVHYIEQRDARGKVQEKEIKRLSDDLAAVNKFLASGAVKIIPIKKEIVKKEDIDKYTLITFEDIQQCIETVKRVICGLNDKGIEEFWQTMEYGSNGLNLRDHLQENYLHLQMRGYTGEELKEKVEQMLKKINFDLYSYSEQKETFWDEYIHLLNK